MKFELEKNNLKLQYQNLEIEKLKMNNTNLNNNNKILNKFIDSQIEKTLNKKNNFRISYNNNNQFNPNKTLNNSKSTFNINYQNNKKIINYNNNSQSNIKLFNKFNNVNNNQSTSNINFQHSQILNRSPSFNADEYFNKIKNSFKKDNIEEEREFLRKSRENFYKTNLTKY